MVSVPVINKLATFKCSHAGTATIATATNKLTVGGDPIVTKAEMLTLAGFSAGCTNLDPNPSGGVQCTAVTYVSGESITLKKGGAFTVLNTAVFTTNSTPVPGTLIITLTQTKLTAA